MYDDHTIVLFNIRGGSNIATEDISVKDVQTALNDTSDCVQTQSASLYHEKDTRKGVFFVVAALYE